jgi:hypothetical protein
MNFQKSDSMNFVTSCHQNSSVVLNAPIDTVWDLLKTFDWAKILPSSVKKTKFLNGNPQEVSSSFEVEYVDGSVWTFRIVEVSELHRAFSYELVTATPQTSFISMQNHIKLHKITFDNTTFVEWTTDFSNDVDSHVVQDNKFKKHEYFKDLKKIFA